MEKAQKVRKRREEFSRYPLVSMAEEVFEWVLDEIDKRTSIMNFNPIQIFIREDTLQTTEGWIYEKNMKHFLKLHTLEELLIKLKDIVDKEDGFEASLNYGAKNIISICINII